VVRSHDGHIFAYSRGGKSEEDRLKSKMSIGLGGHIESAPVNNIEGAGLIQHIKIEAARELKEEIGVELPTREIRIEGLLISGVVEVDRVHLGVYCSVRLSADTQMQFEHQVIEKGQFHHYADLMNTEMLSRMEVWSRLVLTRGFDPM
jgi:predicted NUDIX family phosphoesterase